MTIIAAGISTIANKDAILEKNKQRIIDNFTELTSLTGDNNDIKTIINQNLENLQIEEYSKRHGEFLEQLIKYEENYKLIKEYTKEVEESCKKSFEDSRVNIMCKSYGMLYEEATNTYIETLTNYNNMIKKYNETAEKKFSEHEMLEKEYIDYNHDNSYLGKPKEDIVE